QVLRAEIGAAIQRTTPVLLEGEPGSGREFAARVIHFASPCGGAFLAVECAALSPDALELELFGCLTDAVPGAYSDRAGLVHQAQFGTLFLAEIQALPIEHQRSLLALVDRGEVVRVGATKPESVELRVMASTSVDLEREVRAGRFLPELHARLCAGLIRVPPLRERREDIVDWARAFAREHGARLGLDSLSPEVESLLVLHDWPQNLPELSDAILRALQACHGAHERTVRVEHLPAALRELSGARPRRGMLVPPPPPRATPDGTHVAQASQYSGAGPWLVGVPGRDAAAEVAISLREFEKLCLMCALARTKGDKLKAAKLLAVGKSTFYRKIAKHGL
ncbi:MAG: sigma-54-dependent Fis family transcriptional regulator, partial [Planctomycetota bacterium]